jgi:hypothetical protein
LLTTLVLFADASLLQPWRVPEPDRIRLIRPSGPAADGFAAMRVPEYLALRGRLASWASLSLTLRGADDQVTFDNGATDRVGVLYVSSDYFDTLGLRLPLGRSFTSEEDAFDAPANVASPSSATVSGAHTSAPTPPLSGVRYGSDRGRSRS